MGLKHKSKQLIISTVSVALKAATH